MLFDDPLRNRQAESDTIGRAGARQTASSRWIAAVESVEHVRKMLWQNAYPGVGHGQNGSRSAGANPNPHYATRLSEFDRVVEQNENELPKQRGVAMHGRLLEIVDLEPNRLAIGDAARRLRGIEREVVEEDASPFDRPFARVGAREHQQIFDDCSQPLRLVLDRVQCLDVFFR